MAKLQLAYNSLPPGYCPSLGLMKPETIAEVYQFHKSLLPYSYTPLKCLPKMADYLGLSGVCVKDEGCRMDLSSFKVLGSSYAIAQCVADRLGAPLERLSFSDLTSPIVKEQLGTLTFYTATDGNHGRGVAWTAKALKQQCVVHMPKGTTQTRLNNILALGAKADILEGNYDDCVRQAAAEAAADPKGILIQDTAWEGYTDIPNKIMQGYGTMVAEAVDQLPALGITRPTHIFIQAGVGSLAGAVVGYFTNLYPNNPPIFVVVESEKAACLYKSALAGEGKPQIVKGEMDTIMAGLACGEPNIIAWEILKNCVTGFLTISDDIAAKGMRMLAAPLKDDAPIVSGESGAAGFAALQALCLDPAYAEYKNRLMLTKYSRVMVFSTEADTDPERYKRIVWDGLNK